MAIVRQALRGRAAELVRRLPRSDANCQIMWQMLDGEFGGEVNQISELNADILNLSIGCQGAPALKRAVHTLEISKLQLESMNEDPANNTAFLTSVEGKIPAWARPKYRELKRQAEKAAGNSGPSWNFEDALEALKEVVHLYEGETPDPHHGQRHGQPHHQGGMRHQPLKARVFDPPNGTTQRRFGQGPRNGPTNRPG